MFTYGFDILLQVQIHDDSVETEDTDQFEKTEQLELLGWSGIQEYLKKCCKISKELKLNTNRDNLKMSVKLMRVLTSAM